MQNTSNILMIEPILFGFNEETAKNNYFQKNDLLPGERHLPPGPDRLAGIREQVHRGGSQQRHDQAVPQQELRTEAEPVPGELKPTVRGLDRPSGQILPVILST